MRKGEQEVQRYKKEFEKDLSFETCQLYFESQVQIGSRKSAFEESPKVAPAASKQASG